MWPYALLVLFPIIVPHIRMQHATLYVSRSITHKNPNTLKIFWGILLVLLFLRHEVTGSDVHNYSLIFDSLSHSSWERALNRSAEVAYSVLNKWVSLYTDNFRVIIVISAILSVFFLARAYIKYSEDAALTIALFVITSNFSMLFSGLRQAIAISLGFLAFEFVRKKKLISFLIVITFAQMFHTSAFMLLFMYPLYHVKLKRSSLIGIIPTLGLIFAFNGPIFGYLTSILSRFTDYDTEISSTGAYMMLVLYGVFAVFAYVIPDESQMDQDAIGLRNYLLFSVALQMFAPLHTLAMRMNYYYIAFIPLAIPKIIECRSARWNQIAIAARYVMVIFFIAYFFMTLSRDNPLLIYPYHFMWEAV